MPNITLLVFTYNLTANFCLDENRQFGPFVAGQKDGYQDIDKHR
jgi:hypothetical protein